MQLFYTAEAMSHPVLESGSVGWPRQNTINVFVLKTNCGYVVNINNYYWNIYVSVFVHLLTGNATEWVEKNRSLAKRDRKCALTSSTNTFVRISSRTHADAASGNSSEYSLRSVRVQSRLLHGSRTKCHDAANVYIQRNPDNTRKVFKTKRKKSMHTVFQNNRATFWSPFACRNIWKCVALSTLR